MQNRHPLWLPHRNCMLFHPYNHHHRRRAVCSYTAKQREIRVIETVAIDENLNVNGSTNLAGCCHLQKQTRKSRIGQSVCCAIQNKPRTANRVSTVMFCPSSAEPAAKQSTYGWSGPLMLKWQPGHLFQSDRYLWLPSCQQLIRKREKCRIDCTCCGTAKLTVEE